MVYFIIQMVNCIKENLKTIFPMDMVLLWIKIKTNFMDSGHLESSKRYYKFIQL